MAENPADWPCNVCGAAALTEIPAYRAFRRVASDAKSRPAGGRLRLCQFCGAVQKIADESFLQEIGDIYRTYAVYHQSDGAEQNVFSLQSGAATARSKRMLEALRSLTTLARTGRMLDIGCGTGVMLRAFHDAAPHWKLAGAELSDRFRDIVEAIPNCEKLYSCPPGQIPVQFDLVTMVHSLEHIVDATEFLRGVKAKLAPRAPLMIQVPNLATNPFEIIVADHTSHFTVSSLPAMVKQAGYEVLYFSDTWIAKELTLIARAVDAAPPPVIASAEQVADATETIDRNLRWLAATVAAASQLARRGPIGLFGTSIAATWLSAELGGVEAFFVDEDPSRPGKTFRDRPVLSPGQVPEGSRVFVGLPPTIAAIIRDRLTRPGVEYVASPPLS